MMGKLPLGIKAICLSTIIIVSMVLYLWTVLTISKSIQSASQAEKAEMLNRPEAKQYNIQTIDELNIHLNKMYQENVRRSIWYSFCSIVLVILTIGLCGFKNWARISIIVWSMVILFSTPIKYLGPPLFNLFFCGFVLYYLMLPKVKEQFK